MDTREFAAAVDRLLDLTGWTQGALAERLVVTPARLSEWRTGRRSVPPYIAAHVATLLELEELRGASSPAGAGSR